MSMITTSASSFSAIARATVMPTLPAPPTTVTLRFMNSSIYVSHEALEEIEEHEETSTFFAILNGLRVLLHYDTIPQAPTHVLTISGESPVQKRLCTPL